MVAGQARLGKTTFLATLFDGLVSPPRAEESQESSVIFAPTRAIEVYNFGVAGPLGTCPSLTPLSLQTWRWSRAPACKSKFLMLRATATTDLPRSSKTTLGLGCNA